MRPVRLLLFLTFSVVAVTTLLFLIPGDGPPSNPATSEKKKSKIRAFFSFHTPLFPPSAVISLTDDNSTFFLARPAAFGPLLPHRGLSGQIWIGSGFGEDHVGRPALDSWPEGELGCSDVAGWDASLGRVGNTVLESKLKQKFATPGKDAESEKNGNAGRFRRTDLKSGSLEGSDQIKDAVTDDGTDDYLHQPEPDATGAVKDSSLTTTNKHADIQSLQESAEIEGKIVLLSRGGCGFLEKVKWAQRRGGIALIVGDDIPGGPLVTMYAKGDTTNCTIPALFTSHTTAHLLSSLMPSGGRTGSQSTAAGGKSGTSGGGAGSNVETENPQKPATNQRPASESDDSTEKPNSSAKSSNRKPSQIEPASTKKSKGGFFHSLLSLFGFGGNDGHPNINTRPPSSGDHDWVMVEDWQDEKPKKPVKKLDTPDTSGEATTDDFVIGVHDWRDPDLMKKPSNSLAKPPKTKQRRSKRAVTKEKELKGGSITPGSGEYEKPGSSGDSTSTNKGTSRNSGGDSQSSKKGWLPHITWGDDEEASSEYYADSRQGPAADSQRSKQGTKNHPTSQDGAPHHEGLWVTLTPTNMSSSPFFDTILVLVVSPLVTLTVVYALLLLRSRIRRRRWRAPKSVVDRLPVRTYHTMATDDNSPILSTPIASTPTTPLLQSTSNSRRVFSRSHSRSRPRSRTTSEVPEQAASSSTPLLDESDSISLSESEKREKGLAEWRRRYGGRQKECVVCLEEYIDGVSRVMSLPCGHEFHAECITPWLTTRRRTCPICKGDVVRSMARSTGSSAGGFPPSLSRQSSFGRHAESDEETSLINDGTSDAVQNQAATRRNDSPSAQEPIPVDDEEDLEEGHAARFRRLRGDAWTWSAWRDWAVDNFGLGERPRDREREADRNR